MVEQVAVKKRLFVKIALVVIIVFGAGLIFGYVLDSFRVTFINEEMIAANVDTESFVVAQAYLTSRSDYCRLVPPYLEKLSENVEQLGKDMNSLGSKMVFVNTTFMDRRYFLYEMRLWMMVEEYKVRCDASVNTVLFFYGDDNDESYRQGLMLTALKQKFSDKLMVFSFLHKFSEPALVLVENDFKISKVPTLVVNGKVHEGLVDKTELENFLIA